MHKLFLGNKRTEKSVLYLGVLIGLIFYAGCIAQGRQSKLTDNVMASDIVSVSSPSVEASPTPKAEMTSTTITVGEVRVISKGGLESPTPTPQPLSIEQMIVEELGEGGLEVAMCESSLNPKAKSKISTAKGLFQIINGTWKLFKCTGDPLNAEDNIKCASKIYDHTGGWSTSGGWKASFSCHQQD